MRTRDGRSSRYKEKVRRKKEKVGNKTNSGSIYRATLCLLPFTFFLLCSCADTNHQQPTSRPSSPSERQDQALRDPFGYGPKDRFTDDMPTVTGGQTSESNKKAFKRDVERVFNP